VEAHGDTTPAADGKTRRRMLGLVPCLQGANPCITQPVVNRHLPERNDEMDEQKHKDNDKPTDSDSQANVGLNGLLCEGL